MQDAVARCTSRTDASTIAHMMTHRNFGSLPVVEKDGTFLNSLRLSHSSDSRRPDRFAGAIIRTRSQAGDIAKWGRPERAAVLSTKLRRAFIADLKGRRGRVQTLSEHQAPRFVQSQSFLILQWAHRRQHSKMMVEGGGTHINLAREFLDSAWPREIIL
jgi:hypothetical protein